MSLPLFKQSFKSNFGLWAIVTVVMNVILGQLVSLKMFALVPQMYFGMLAFAMVSLFIVITANKLLVDQVDRGSMAYILSTPIKRRTVVFTQLIYLVGSLAITFLLLGTTFMVTNNMVNGPFSNEVIIHLTLGAYATSLALSGIVFASSGFFNLSKYSMSTGGLLVVAFLLIAIIASFSNYGVSDLDALHNFTIISLFDINNIIKNGTEWLPKAWTLVAIALVGYGFGTVSFIKKDLPL